MEEDLVIGMDDDDRDLFWSELQLKTTFLYIALSRVISSSESDERREALTLLTNKLFYFLEEVIDLLLSWISSELYHGLAFSYKNKLILLLNLQPRWLIFLNREAGHNNIY